MSSERILIIDDDRDILKAAGLYLKQHFGFVKGTSNPEKIPEYLGEASYDVVLLDMNFTGGTNSGREGYKWLRKIKELDPPTAVIFITAYGDVEKAVKAIKMGAADFILKPWNNEKLLATVNSALNLSNTKRENNALRNRQKFVSSQIDREYQNMVGQSDPMQKVFALIDKVAGTSANVLITGENGTGKELIARAIHRRSERSGEVFVKVDIGSLSESLFESELFGHAKGAFTDAKEARPGRFEIADGGTLFLDEIGNLPFSLQPKLLSAIENRKITRIGTHKAKDVDIRLICATNESLETLSDPEKFREDLLFRINTIHIAAPPLRKRKEDIPLLVKHFMDIFKDKYGQDIREVSDSAMAALKDSEWPGNVRELEHAVERAMIMADSSILKTQDFFADTATQTSGNDDLNLREVEKKAIIQALHKYNQNITQTAKALGVSRAALYRRIEKYGL